MSTSQTILLAGGGTGGHLYPGIAVAQALAERGPRIKPIFLCTQRPIDRAILEPTGFEFLAQPIVPPVRTVGGLLKFWRGWRETKDLVKHTLRQHRPAAVVGLGGYAAGVAVKVASQRGLPTAILNPDLIPGQANRYLMRFSTAVCCQFQDTSEHVFPEHWAKLELTGCPIRTELRSPPSRETAAGRLGLDPLLQTLVITGASLGAQSVNEAVLAMLRSMTLRGWQILHLAGKEHAEAVRAGYRDLALSARVIDFTAAMADVWAVADLAISRAGASSCAELTACGVPSVLMPYPYHKDLHQRANAQVLAAAGAAVLVDDQKDAAKNAQSLRPVVESLLYDAPRRQAMGKSARALGRPDAAAAVADVVLRLIPEDRSR